MSKESGGEDTSSIGAAVVAVLGFIERVFAPLIPDFLKKSGSRPTITEVPRDSRPWHLARQQDGTYLIQLDNEWVITNNSDQPLRIVRAEVNRHGAQGGCMIEAHGIFGSHSVPPRATVRMITHFFIPASKYQWPGSKWFDFTFTDHTGYTTKKRSVEVKPERRVKRKVVKLNIEAAAEIADEDERALAILLKEELARYRANGRQSGGLGSIYGHKGSEIHKSMLQQEGIIIGDASAKVTSELGDRIVQYYQGLPPDRQARFKQHLLSRIDRDREYYGVSYMIVYALWRIGELPQALATVLARYEYKPTLYDRVFRRRYVKRVLEQEQRFGYSDVLGLMHGLLRFEHQNFSNAELDALDRFAHRTSERPFRVPEKVVSIRAHRIQA